MGGASLRDMHALNRLGIGLCGGAAGLVAMALTRRLAQPLVRRRESPTAVFLTERTMSPFGPQHEHGEAAATAFARMAYQKVTGRRPTRKLANGLSWGVRVGYGLAVASLFGVLRARRARALRDGLVFGAGLWLIGDVLAVPLLGLADKPTTKHATEHLQSLAAHLGFGVATAGTVHLLREMR